MRRNLTSMANFLWGASHVSIFDGGLLQMGYYPDFVSDGNGGAVFGWYTSYPSLQCYVQRVYSSGAEAFAHNGVEASTNMMQCRVNPDVGVQG